MENFNKNWLAILLVAVVFATLGFLVGKTTGSDKAHRMMRFQSDDVDEFNFKLKVDDDTDDDREIVKIDTVMKDGKQIITKTVKKIVKH